MLAQALESSHGNVLADDFHGFEQRRGHAAAAHGHAHRAESQTRLVAAVFDQRLVQRLVQEVGLPITLSNGVQRRDRSVEHGRSGILQLLLGVGVRLDVAFGGQQGADHAGHFAQQAHARSVSASQESAETTPSRCR